MQLVSQLEWVHPRRSPWVRALVVFDQELQDGDGRQQLAGDLRVWVAREERGEQKEEDLEDHHLPVLPSEVPVSCATVGQRGREMDTNCLLNSP